ncbi:hypothetical protein GCM10010176_045390 [Nonomuraea spiralis]|nr:hypothetical protein GCM10010176_045390 [Nonomuraea spiralis]
MIAVPGPGSPARVAGALAITQTAGYGVLYYAFSVFIPPMARDLRAWVAQLTGAITLSVLVSALVAPAVGRLLDRHGGRALPAVTVVAGFASTVFLPLTGLLVDRYGWRHALVVLAAGYTLTSVPLHAPAVRGRGSPSPPAERREIVGAALRERPFWLLGVLSVTGRLVTTGLQSRWPVALITAAMFAVQGVAALPLPLAGDSRAGPSRGWCCSGWGSGWPRSPVPPCSPTGTARPRTRR